ncbi:MAG TPA: EAL domain-containing protein [Microthrixaceae bacterium]|nr:EAL domain-containing protein [Microthrixaceae bacterium]
MEAVTSHHSSAVKDSPPEGSWTKVAQSRLIASLAIPAIIAALPRFGEDRLLVAAIAGVISLLSNLLLLTAIRRNRPIAAALAVVDLGLVLAVVASTPSLYAAGVTLIISMSAFYASWLGWHATLRLLIPTGLALLIIGVGLQPDLWVTSWLAWFVASVFGTTIMSSLSSSTRQARNRFDDLINGIDAVVWESPGASQAPTYLSDRIEEVLGHSMEDCTRPGFLESQVHSEDIEAYRRSRADIAEGRDTEVHYRIHDSHGETRSIHEKVVTELDSDGRTKCHRGVIVDETARYQAERSVRGYGEFIKGAPMAMAIFRLDNLDEPTSLRVVTCNPAAASMVGTTADEATNMRLSDLVVNPKFLEQLARVVILNTSLEVAHLRVDTTDSIYSLRAMPLPDQCLGVALDDITKVARTAETLRHQALHDHLTGLPNRAHFKERLDTAVEQTVGIADQAGTGSRSTDQIAPDQVAVIMIDLNKFKEVNDSLGHEFGDRLLIDLSQRLARNLRGCDTIARLGGDEFAILIRSSDAGRTAADVAQRVQDLCCEPFKIDGYLLKVGASVGYAVHSDGRTDARSLMRDADAAMYRAKESGGGIVRHESGSAENEASRLTLTNELSHAVESDEFVVHYQPRIDLTSMETVGVEALVRWKHPKRGLLPPKSFIELAEASGVISQLTRLVTERAASELHDYQVENGSSEGLSISINMSERMLADPMFVQSVADIIDRIGVTASSLCFELTENDLASDPANALVVLHRLSSLGVRLSLDNFGTGHSSLSFLRDLPLDEVKIDQTFVADMQAGDETIVRTVIEMGHSLGLHVVAEGVESQDLVVRLQALGCDSAQGFHLARPMDIVSLREFLNLNSPANVTGS